MLLSSSALSQPWCYTTLTPLPRACITGYTAQPVLPSSPSPALCVSSSCSRPSCQMDGRSEGLDQRRTRLTRQTDQKDRPDHSTPSLKIAAPTIIQFDRVSLLSARLWLVPPPLATLDMPPLPPMGFPYRPCLIRPSSDLLLFSSLSFFHQRPMSCLALPRARCRLHENQKKNPHHGACRCVLMIPLHQLETGLMQAFFFFLRWAHTHTPSLPFPPAANVPPGTRGVGCDISSPHTRPPEPTC